MPLKSLILPPDAISTETRNSMFSLLSDSFLNVKRSVFEKDISEKNLVILLFEDMSLRLAGFSTMKFLEHDFCGTPVRITFSGDTIIRQQNWGSMELPLAWGSLMLELWEKSPHVPHYWMLISKGVRTYKYLPTFFKSYYPSPVDAPKMKELVSELAQKMFGKSFDINSGLILPSDESYFLTPELAEISRPPHQNSSAHFFLNRNPLYRSGAELACLAQFAPDNLSPFYYRSIKRRMAIQSTLNSDLLEMQ